MTMNTGIARAVRRLVGASAIMLSVLAGIHRLLYVQIDLPPANVDRIVVTSPSGRSHEITDRATVAQVVRLFRSQGGHAVPVRLGYNPYWRVWAVAFHRGTEHHGRFTLTGQAIFAHGVLARNSTGEAVIRIGTEEALDLHRLLRAGTSLAPSAQGGCG
jgi:hypothetical protein